MSFCKKNLIILPVAFNIDITTMIETVLIENQRHIYDLVTEHAQVNNEVNNTYWYVNTLLRVTHSSRRPFLGTFS